VLGPIAATELACRDLDVEAAFFAALADARFSEVSGAVLILTDEAGGEMVFRADDR
jgi:heat shock protein HslJ